MSSCSSQPEPVLFGRSVIWYNMMTSQIGDLSNNHCIGQLNPPAFALADFAVHVLRFLAYTTAFKFTTCNLDFEVQPRFASISASICACSLTFSMDYYLKKTFLKTASLMAHSSKAVAVLGGHDSSVCNQAYEYGKHLVSSCDNRYCALCCSPSPSFWLKAPAVGSPNMYYALAM